MDAGAMLLEAGRLHALWQRATGRRDALDYSGISAWVAFVQAGFRAADLAVVAGYLNWRIASGCADPAQVRFRNLIGNLDLFGVYLKYSRARCRIVRPGYIFQED